MFSYTIDNQSVVFFVAGLQPYQIMRLQPLLDNGFAKLLPDNSISVPQRNIYELDPVEMEMLGLPPFFPFEIQVKPNGNMASPEFCYEILYRSFAPAGKIFPLIERKGAFIKVLMDNQQICYLLNQEQFQLVSAIQEFNDLPLESKSKAANNRKFAGIKELSVEASAVLDATLASKDVILPKNIKIHVSKNDAGELTVTPSVDGVEQGDFTKAIDKKDGVAEEYPIFKPGKKTVVVLDEPQKNELAKVQEIRVITDPEKAKDFIENPEKYLDPEFADISELYSDRVIGLGVYEPKVYPFVSPYESEWIPSFRVDDRTNGTTDLYFRNIDELADLEIAIQDAKSKNQHVFEYKGANLTIDFAEKMLEKATEVLKKHEPVTEEGPSSEEEKKKKGLVLLIKENMEEVEIDKSTGRLKLPKDATLGKDPFLNDDISLKDHQEEGVAWLQYFSSRASGVLLADDMGLGKTLQVLYLMDWHYRTQNEANKPYLIVAPVSLLENWRNEYAKFFRNGMIVDIIEHAPAPDDANFVKAHSFKHIMLMSYECMRRGQLTLGKIDFSIIALDEAQKIKEPGTMVTNAAKALKGDFKISMTGTPVENTFMNLWCIMDFSVPGYLGNAKDFAAVYQAPLSKKDTDIEKLGEQLHEALGGYFLRRLKTDVAKDLPSKNLIPTQTLMPKVQLERYISAIHIAQEGLGGSALQRIQELRRISDHPYLDSKNWDDFSVDELIGSSAKLMATMNILDDIRAKGEKAIIFTERRDMQRMLQKVLLERYNLVVSVINGESSTTSKGNKQSRQSTVDAFQSKNDFNVIVMSQLAAGVGLNVVGANHVIHYSRHWNPAKENQATDRVYRIGQTKEVFVHYPMAIAEGFKTFDLVLDDLLQRKMSLASASLYPTERIEVKPDELEDILFSGEVSKEDKVLVCQDDINSMDDFLFEAFIGVLYGNNGYDANVTPRSGDKGVDVVARKEQGNLAIQCKHTKTTVGADAVGEIVAGAKYYECREGSSFKPVVITNGSYTTQAKEMAHVNGVELIDGEQLKKLYGSNDISWHDVYKADQSRKK